MRAIHTKPQSNLPPQKNTCLSQEPQKNYSFKDDKLLKIFNVLVNNNKIELTKLRRPEEVGHSKDPKYCHYHMIISHSIKDCFALK